MNTASHHYGSDFMLRNLLPHVPLRQFEFGYNEAEANVVATGTTNGVSLIVQLRECPGYDFGKHPHSHMDSHHPHASVTPGARVVGAVRYCGLSRSDPVLAVCWLRKNAFYYVTGSASGRTSIINASSIAPHLHVDSGDDLGAFVPELPVVFRGRPMDNLTSVHVNMDDTRLLASGYSFSVPIHDLATGAVVRTFEKVHDAHINIARFANTSPNIFATSSFDSTVKVWDLREARSVPVYTVKSKRGNVTISFSPDDQYLLSSGVDNEIHEYIAADGRLYCSLEIQETGLSTNYTRAYYADGGATVVSGGSEESVVRLHSALTGELLRTVQLHDGRFPHRLYLQSLRGHPCRRGYIGALISYYGPDYGHCFFTMDLYKSFSGEKAPTGFEDDVEAANAARMLDDSCTRMSGPNQSARSLQASPSYLMDMWRVFRECQDDGIAAELAAYNTLLTLHQNGKNAANIAVYTPPSSSASSHLGSSGADVTILCDNTRMSGLLGVLYSRLPLIRKLFDAAGKVPTPVLLVIDTSMKWTFEMVRMAVLYAVVDAFIFSADIPTDNLDFHENAEQWAILSVSSTLSREPSLSATAFNASKHVKLSQGGFNYATGRFGPLFWHPTPEDKAVISPWDPLPPVVDQYVDGLATRSNDKYSRTNNLFLPGRVYMEFSDGAESPFPLQPARATRATNVSAEFALGSYESTLDQHLGVGPKSAHHREFDWDRVQSDVHAFRTFSATPVRITPNRTDILLTALKHAARVSYTFSTPRVFSLAMNRMQSGESGNTEITASNVLEALEIAWSFDSQLNEGLTVCMEKLAALQRHDYEYILHAGLLQVGQEFAASASRPQADVRDFVWCCVVIAAMHFGTLCHTHEWREFEARMSGKAPALFALLQWLYDEYRLVWPSDQSRQRLASRTQPLPMYPIPVAKFVDGIIPDSKDCRSPEYLSELARRLTYFKENRHVDPVFELLGFPAGMPRVHANALITAGQVENNRIFSRALLVGGHNQTNDLSSKITYAVDMPSTNDTITWRLCDNGGDRPRSLMYHKMASIGGAPARFYVVTNLMDSTLASTDFGPGSSAWVAPPRFHCDGTNTTIHPQPFNFDIPTSLVKAITLARVYVLDTRCQRWHSITPELANLPQGWNTSEFDIRTLSRPPMEYIPTPRYGGTFCTLQHDYDIGMVQNPAGPISQRVNILLFGGYTEKFAEHPAAESSERNDLHELSIDIKQVADKEWTYHFAWRTPKVSGDAPAPRSFHAAASLSLPRVEGGDVMVVFGGQRNRYLADCFVLTQTAIGDETSYTWHPAEVCGKPPAARSSHTMTALFTGPRLDEGVSTHEDVRRRSFLLFGGVGRRGVLNDIHVGTLSRHMLSGAFVLRFSQPNLLGDLTSVPCPRKWHACVYAPDWPKRKEHAPETENPSSVEFAAYSLVRDNAVSVPGALLIYGGRDVGPYAELPELTEEQRAYLDQALPKEPSLLRSARSRLAEYLETGDDPQLFPSSEMPNLRRLFPRDTKIDEEDFLQPKHNLYAADTDAEADDHANINMPPRWRDENVDANLYVLHLDLTLDISHSASVDYPHRSSFTTDETSKLSTAQLKHIMQLMFSNRIMVGSVYNDELATLAEPIRAILSSESTTPPTSEMLGVISRMLHIYRSQRKALDYADAHKEPDLDALPGEDFAQRLSNCSAAIRVHSRCQFTMPFTYGSALRFQLVPRTMISTIVQDMTRLVPGSRDILVSNEAPKPIPTTPFGDFTLQLSASDGTTTDEMRTYASLLRARSLTFYTMLGSRHDGFSFKEASMNSADLQSDLDPRTAVFLLHYIVTDTLHPRLDPETALNLIVAAERYQIPRLACLIECMMVHEINDDNVCGLLSFIEAQDAGAGSGEVSAAVGIQTAAIASRVCEERTWSTLRAACVSYIMRNYTRLQGTEDFAALEPHLRLELQQCFESGAHIYAKKPDLHE